MGAKLCMWKGFSEEIGECILFLFHTVYHIHIFHSFLAIHCTLPHIGISVLYELLPITFESSLIFY
jgi:hypothetical protein